MSRSTPQYTDPAGYEDIPGAVTAKTPVTVLQEWCVKQGIYPMYDLRTDTTVHPPIYEYQVIVGGIIANGSGQTKKAAKHATAEAMLNFIRDCEPGAPWDDRAAAQLPTQFGSPYNGANRGNQVGFLQELCMTGHWPYPNYELISEKGPPHNRTFSFACTIGNLKEIGTGKSKKLAKCQAAFKMSQRLIVQPPVSVPADE